MILTEYDEQQHLAGERELGVTLGCLMVQIQLVRKKFEKHLVPETAAEELELDKAYVLCAVSSGASRSRVLFVHILPNAMVSMLTSATVGFNNAVLAEASMSYLGLGVQPPEPSLGLMLSDAQAYLQIAPWAAIFPGLMIVVIILGFSMISEGLRVHQTR